MSLCELEQSARRASPAVSLCLPVAVSPAKVYPAEKQLAARLLDEQVLNTPWMPWRIAGEVSEVWIRKERRAL
jgi:hypothetical protein